MGVNKQLRKAERKKHKFDKASSISELLSWLPELLILPIRFFIWLFRNVAKLFTHG